VYKYGYTKIRLATCITQAPYLATATLRKHTHTPTCHA
jgi:hypothetical protein